MKHLFRIESNVFYFLLFLSYLPLFYAEPFSKCNIINCGSLHGSICSQINNEQFIISACPSDLICQFIDTFLLNYTNCINITHCVEANKLTWNLKYEDIEQIIDYECKRLTEIKTLPILLNS